MKKLSKTEAQYWSNICITASQVFFGIFAAALFIGSFDLKTISVVFLSSSLTIVLWIVGWRLIK